MKIAVIGAGAIGSLLAGYLKLKGEEVILTGHADAVAAIKNSGLHIVGVRGDFDIRLDTAREIDVSPDLVILATKTQDIRQALKENAAFVRGCPVVTTQNGVQADMLVAEEIARENIISSIVMFGATYLEPGQVVHNFEGAWILGRAFAQGLDDAISAMRPVLDKAFPTIVSPDIRGMKYLKVFINANNCIPAILGVSMQEAFTDPEVSAISIAIWKEGLEIITKAGIALESLPGFPVENITKLTSLPTIEAARIFSGMMAKLSKEPLYGSVLQSIKRGRPSEIEYINGEFVSLARHLGRNAPLNERLVEMVHAIEKNKKFFRKEELLEATKGLVG